MNSKCVISDNFMTLVTLQSRWMWGKIGLLVKDFVWQFDYFKPS